MKRLLPNLFFVCLFSLMGTAIMMAQSPVTDGSDIGYKRVTLMEKLAKQSKLENNLFVRRLKNRDNSLSKPHKVLLRGSISPSSQTGSATPKKVKLATTSTGAEIWGYIEIADSWYDTYGDQTSFPTGIYKFTPGIDSYSKLFELTGVDLNGGAAIYNNVFHGISYSVDWSTYDFVLKYYEYNTTDWTPTENNGKSVPNNSLGLMAASSTVDPTDNKVYACVSNPDLTAASEYLLAIVDYDDLSYSKIKEIDYPYVAMAINADGELYAVNNSGDLLKVDKATGAETIIGNTGLKPTAYFQSAAFDTKANTLYWAATTKDGTSALYQVNTETGAATAVSTFSDYENISFLYVNNMPEADAPGKVTNLETNFLGESLSGSVSFILPTQTFSGQALTGTVHFTLTDNGTVLIEGDGQPGEKITKSLTVEAGSHVFSVNASNANGTGQTAQVKAWIGPDAAQSVENVILNITDNEASLSWTAPTEGKHQGYIDSSKLSYDIVRFPGNDTVATGLKATTFNETLADAPYTAYYYKVVVNYEGTQSEPVSSNIVCFGHAIVPPYDRSFTSIDSTYEYSVIDNNKDGITWSFSDGEMMYMSMRAMLDADDWVVTPPFQLKNDRQYKVYFMGKCYSESDVEQFGLYMGADTVGDITNYEPVMNDTSVHSISYVPVGTTVSVKSNGAYRFAIKAVGYTGLAEFVKSFSIHEGSQFAAPDSVESLSVEADPTGALKATISMQAPTQTVDGQTLTGTMSVKVYRGSVSQDNLVKTVDGVSPGQQVVVSDEPLTSGIVSYYAVAANDYGDGIENTASAYIGFDTPLAPTNITLKDNLDGTATLTWDTPAGTGVHEGPVDLEHLTYNIYSVSNGTPSLLKSGVQGNSYDLGEIADAGSQKLTFYAMKAVANDLQSQYGISTMLMTGAPYTLPFKESFPDGYNTNYWASTVTKGNSDEGFDYTNIYSYDGDEGCAFYNTSATEGEAVLTSGKISLTGSAAPYLYLSYLALPGLDMQLKILVQENGGEADTLQVIDYSKLTGNDGWRKLMIDLSHYSTSKYIQLDFDAHISGTEYPILIDDIRVKDDYPYDLEVSANAPTKAKAGEKMSVSIDVNNTGTESMDNFTVGLLVNGEEVARQSGKTLGVNVDSVYTFDYLVPVNSDSILQVQGKVLSDFDMDESNNISSARSVEVYMPDYPVVSDLQATGTSQQVNLSWTTAKGQKNLVTDDFENYDAFAIDQVGSWKLVDADKAYTYSVSSVSYDHANQPFAYIVFNPSEVSATDASIQPHSGKQYMASMASPASLTPDGHNDDWLISPELPGVAQTISLWVKSLNDSYGLEKYQVLYSTNGTDTADFKEISTAEAPSDAWTKVTSELPEGTKYFAIRCISEERFMFMLDDVTYQGMPLEVKGYNIYCDGNFVGSASADATTFSLESDGKDHVYNITVVYAAGESAFSNSASIASTGIANVSNSEIAVLGGHQLITVLHADGKPVSIYRPDGSLVAKFMGSNRNDVPVAKGIYLVRADNKVFKLSVE